MKEKREWVYGKAVCVMDFLDAFVSTGVKFLLFGGVAFGAIMLGIWLRKRKNANADQE